MTFSPLSWLKLRLFLHSDEVEVGGFGLSSQDNLLYVEDLLTVRQQVSAVTVAFEDAAVADHFEDCADRGIAPSRCGRLWIHTHPGDSSQPSFTDEETFGRVFGGCDWAAMVIVARGGDCYCRLQFAAGPGGQVLIPVAVDWESYPQLLMEREGGLDELFGQWMDEYGRNVHPEPIRDPLKMIPQAKLSAAAMGRDYHTVADQLDDLYSRRLLDDEFEAAYCDMLLQEVER